MTTHHVAKACGPEALKSDESDQSEDNVVSDDEGASVADSENEWPELVDLYAALIMLQLLREMSASRPAMESGALTPTESMSAGDGRAADEASSPCNAVSGLKGNSVDITPELTVCIL